MKRCIKREGMTILHMNKANREASYAKNCTMQIISSGNTILEKAVVESLEYSLPKNMGIADLGCSSGPNTLMVTSEIINIVLDASHKIGHPLSELRVSLNDLPGNDFSDVFMSLPDFYRKINKEKSIGSNHCFISATAGSFYGRLFPTASLHFVHSSSSLHWLSEV